MRVKQAQGAPTFTQRLYCRACGGLVVKNYDHTGACDVAGGCPGTFAHAWPYRPCELVRADLHHDAVTPTPTPNSGATP